jgi:hypothetical protein
MKPVKLYTIREEEIFTYSREYIQVYKPISQTPLIPFAERTYTELNNVEKLNLPIHHIQRCERPDHRLLYPDYNSRRHIKDFYVAIEPALREILETPYKGQVEFLERDNGALRRRFGETCHELRVEKANFKELSLKVENSVLVDKNSLLGKAISWVRKLRRKRNDKIM